jgi:hypothetical protein
MKRGETEGKAKGARANFEARGRREEEEEENKN